MDQTKIGSFIAERRKEIGLTQAQLGEKLGVTDKSVSKWERGICLPDVSNYMELCSILGISLNEFFAGEYIRGEELATKSESNIMSISKDSANKISHFKRLSKILLVVGLALAVAMAGLFGYLYKSGFFDKNYIKAYEPSDSQKDVAGLFSAGDTALLEISADEGYKSVSLQRTFYKHGKKVKTEDESGIELVSNDKVKCLLMISVRTEDDGFIYSATFSNMAKFEDTKLIPFNTEPEECIYGMNHMLESGKVTIKKGKAIPIAAHIVDTGGENSFPAGYTTEEDFQQSISSDDYCCLYSLKFE